MKQLLLFIAFLLMTVFATAVELTPKEQKQIEKLSNKLVSALTKKDTRSFSKLLDHSAIVDRAVSNPKLPEELKDDYQVSIAEQLEAIIMPSVRFNGLSNFTIANIAYTDKGATLTVQSDGDGQNDHWDMHIAKSKRGKFKIVDWLSYDMGVPLSSQLLFGQAQDRNDIQSWVAALNSDVSEADYEVLKQLFGVIKSMEIESGLLPKWVATYEQLSEPLQAERALIRTWTFNTIVEDDKKSYFMSLGQIDKYHSENWRECQLLREYYTHIEQANKAQECNARLIENLR